MGFAFDETMAGTFELTKEPGVPYPLRFRATVHAPWIGSKCEMTGTIEAAPIAKDAPFEGRMILRPFLGRIIRYELEFAGDDGRRYTLAGQKDIKLFDLARSWTTLPAEIKDDRGAVVATCETRFDMAREALAFISSFRPA
ncbi:MAG TPA: hypothetical protein VL463_14105 [Kofleriaceae bacterium]|jgi:hypothetical protein|nr:hypothetical protein [Kofleriaceae bacterium]